MEQLLAIITLSGRYDSLRLLLLLFKMAWEGKLFIEHKRKDRRAPKCGFHEQSKAYSTGLGKMYIALQ
jgi:hypothetical protein